MGVKYVATGSMPRNISPSATISATSPAQPYGASGASRWRRNSMTSSALAAKVRVSPRSVIGWMVNEKEEKQHRRRCRKSQITR